MKRTAASPNRTSRKRNEKLGRFWQSEIAAASAVYAFIDGQLAFVGFSQQAAEFSREKIRPIVLPACDRARKRDQSARPAGQRGTM
jgi:hypothetical protein